MKKVSLSFLVAGAIFMSGNGLSVDAAGTGDNSKFTADIKSSSQKRMEQEKEKDFKQWKETKSAKVGVFAIPGGTYRAISVPSFKQETSYWCGPATTKQVLHYLNGSSSSQSTYASGLGTTTAGTDFSKIDDYLNSKQSKNNYIYSSGNSYSTWSDRIDYSLSKSVPAPVVLDLEIYPSYMPKYTTHIAGHILNVSGEDSRNSPVQIRLTDPYDQGSRGVTLGNVWHPHKGVYDANMDHFRQAILW
ncbi:C39 family peptidase [Fictibacillus nanhaiensis]|uniref:C39 family peptidase n=1 Tax=Fictibacillus nanhaiensis TaxID=742169 RepID=A0ABS2ZPQ0_9BACL|nr:C39 family peptidase [Fictibacillus nanhaiensis]